MGGFLSMVTAPPPPPAPHLVAPGTGQGATAEPLPPSQQTAFGPVNAKQRAAVGDQEINVSNTDFSGIGTAALVLGLFALVALLVWWLL